MQLMLLKLDLTKQLTLTDYNIILHNLNGRFDFLTFHHLLWY